MANEFDRRTLLLSSGFIWVLTTEIPKALANAPRPAVENCLARTSELSTESVDSPFFQHYHQLSIPVAALLLLPQKGVVVETSQMDPESYDAAGFRHLVETTSLDPKNLARHTHQVHLKHEVLSRIAAGEKDVEVRVISANGNYVHNFLLTATPSTLAKVKRYRQGKLKVQELRTK